MHERTRTAFHEAGHAVMAWLHWSRLRAKGVSVHVDRDGVLAAGAPERGLTDLQAQASRHRIAGEWEEAANRPGIQWRVEAEVLILQAGRAAETIAMQFGLDQQVDHRFGEGCIDDRDQAMALVEALQSLLFARTPSVDEVVGWVADKAISQAIEILRRPDVWSAVTRVATALDVSGHLSSEDFEKLLDEAPPTRARRHWELP